MNGDGGESDNKFWGLLESPGFTWREGGSSGFTLTGVLIILKYKCKLNLARKIYIYKNKFKIVSRIDSMITYADWLTMSLFRYNI